MGTVHPDITWEMRTEPQTCSNDFAALTIRRFTADWKLNENDIDNALMEVEILRARWRIALARG
jgi:hypothetical protein